MSRTPLKSNIDVHPQRVHTSVATLFGQTCQPSDDVISAAVDYTLSAIDCLRGTGHDEVSVGVRGGVVALRGHVLSKVLKDRLEQAARSVPGVLGVDSRLVDDDGLAIAAAQALGRDARTHSHPLRVVAYRGFVTLRGQVDSSALRSAAEEVVASLPQVRGVINEVAGPGGARGGETPMPPLQPAVRQEIYASDMPLGHVTHVMISRFNRLVTAVVAQGDFPDVRLDQRISIFDDVPLRERQVVIPIGAVRFTTDSAMFLAVNGAAASVYRDLVPSDMVYPDPHWEPPYPYRPSDVLLAHGGHMRARA